MLAPREHKRIEELCAKQADFDSVTKMLQYDTITCHQVRAHFDGTMEFCPETRSRLSQDASIITHPTFESAIIKIQSDKAHDTSEEEKIIVRVLKREEICTLSIKPKNPCRSLPGLWNAFAPPVIAMQHTSTHDSSYLLPTSVKECFIKQAMPYQTAESASFRRNLNSKYIRSEQGLVGYSGRKLFDRELDDN